MRLAAYVTTFDRPAILATTLTCFLEQTRPPEFILVVDNGSNPDTGQVVRAFPPERVGYHRMGRNAGPAGAGAFGLRHLVDRGYDWVLCGDDDDPPLTPDTLQRLMALARDAGAGLGAVGATGTPWDWERGVRRTRFPLPPRGVVDVDVVGGSKLPIVSREAVHAVGVHNPDLFFGQEEFEYCLRIRRAGLRIVVDAQLFWEYSRLFENRETRTLAPGVHRPRDQLWRQYYGTRNYIHFMLREFRRPDLARREAAKALGRAARSWSQGPAYGLAYSRLQLRAVADGYRGRLGLTVPPAAKYAAHGE